ncbi:APC amino acid permease [Leucogyrophana mollusca]|uniref:APC amino acid permease n=1 Tax=Leucogyrophana mollusca TaxID=85980 RepID=A0ACB8BM22_9AGAM|nr:APC amino acid permease [Leucogyrophana mollusca]
MVLDFFQSVSYSSPISGRQAARSIGLRRAVRDDEEDNKELEALGYVPSFRREFSNLATISFAFSIMGVCSSVASTFNTPLLLGGPASVTWCWILGASNCLSLASSIAEIISAYPTCGGLYTASAQLCPRKHRPRVGWIVGWLNILGQFVGLSSSEFGLANMILAAVSVGTNGAYEITANKVVGLTTGLLIVHGLLNSLKTRQLAYFTSSFVFVNLGATFVITITLLATTSRAEMHPASYVFGADGLVNGTGGWNTGISFLLGLLSVQWTMTGYDSTAHISEEVRRAAYAAPVAIIIATFGTAVSGWLLNIVLILCSGPLADLPGPSGSAFLAIMVLRMGKHAALALWFFVCLTAFFVCQSGLQAGSRTIYAFSRDHGLPDAGFFGQVSSSTQTPLRAVWLTTLVSVLPGLLDLASPIAANAIFAMTAMAADLSYIIPVFLRRVYHSHPEVQFKPGPYYMGDGWLGWAANVNCIVWTLFVCVIFSLPTEMPVTSTNMNYSAVITVGVVLVSGAWYVLSAHRHYHGPASNLPRKDGGALGGVEAGGEKIARESAEDV